MMGFNGKNGQSLPGASFTKGRGWTVLGFVVLWAASLAFVFEIYNLAVLKRFEVDFDPSFEILAAAFFFLLALLSGLLLWRNWRAQVYHPAGTVDRLVIIGIIASVISLFLVFISGAIVYSSDRAFLKQQTHYVRPAPRPDFSLSGFPTPVSSQPTPTYDPRGKYLAGALLGSIDHLRVGDIQISASPDNATVYYVQFNVQPVECLVDQNGKLTTFAVDKSKPLISGPLRVQAGRFYASQQPGVVIGKVISDQEIMGTAYLHYTDPSSGRTCDLGTFEFDAFMIGNP